MKRRNVRAKFEKVVRKSWSGKGCTYHHVFASYEIRITPVSSLVFSRIFLLLPGAPLVSPFVFRTRQPSFRHPPSSSLPLSPLRREIAIFIFYFHWLSQTNGSNHCYTLLTLVLFRIRLGLICTFYFVN